MNINYKEAQFEFFPNTVSTPDETKRPHFMAARFNLSIENLVIFSIVSIMVVIFTFSLGVERGKRIALRDGVPLALDVKAPESPVAGSDASAPAVSAKAADPEAAKDPAAVVSQDMAKKPSGVYTVQVASYKTEKSAQKEAQALLKKGFKAFTLPKGQHVVLCVGNFQKREEASIFGKKLKSNYQDFVVRRL